MQFHSLEKRRKIELFISTILGLIGVFLVLLKTSKYGAAMTPDGTLYISIARNLVSNGKYESFLNDPEPQFPPLFPLLLASLGFLGIDPYIGARFVNAIVFGLIVFLSRKIFSEFGKDSILDIVGQLFILFSIPLLFVSKYACTEPLFILLLTLFSIYFFKLIEAPKERKRKYILILSIISALCNLQRYIGIFVILVFGFQFLFIEKEYSVFRRIKIIFLFCLISLIPLSIWILRNLYITGTFLGARPPPRPFLSNVYQFINTVATWLISPDIIPFVKSLLPDVIKLVFLIGGFILIGILGSYLIFLDFQRNRENKIYLIKFYHIGLMMISYTSLLFYTALQFRFDIMNNRIVSPLYLYVIAIILIILKNFIYLIKSLLVFLSRRFNFFPKALKHNRIPLLFEKIIIIFMISILLIHPFFHNYESLIREMQKGAGGYTYYYFKESEIIKYVQNKEWDGKIYSNDPHLIYTCTTIIPYNLPYKDEDISEFKETIENEPKVYLIWFIKNYVSDNYIDLREIKQNFNLKIIKSFSDGNVCGTVYQFI
ncbi:MAG: ArnT family glycosyltransferase [Promethearchaeota archaeon]